MIIVNLVFYDIMSVYFISFYYVQFYQRVRISTFMFLQGRSLNPYFERHSFMLLDNDICTYYKQQGAFSRYE